MSRSAQREGGDHASALRCAFYGDDFTGATDTLATYAESGLSALLFLGVPNSMQLARAGALDAIGIAGAARSMGEAAMVDELAPVAGFFASLRAPVVHYKCCSTFDSAPAVGNFATALRTLRPAAPNPFLPIVGGQPNLGRYCAFGNLFAAAGAGGEAYRLDRHPTMSRHPVTPMHEPDLRRHLSALGIADVALVDWRELERDDEGLDVRVVSHGAVLFDVLTPGHLTKIGRIICERARMAPLLALGASSVAQALIAHWAATLSLPNRADPSPIKPASGPVLVVAGSRSPITAAQVEHAASSYERVAIDVQRIVMDDEARNALADRCAAGLNSGRSVLAHTGEVEVGGPDAAAVARACGHLLADTLRKTPHVRRVGIAGGDTSSLAVRQLEIWAVAFAGWLAPGVALVRARSQDPALDGLELMLKGGQMGPVELFATLVGGT